MSVTAWISLAGILLGLITVLITVYFAIWSRYGVNEVLQKGFGELHTSGARLITNVEGRIGDLVDIIKFLASKEGGTVPYKLEKLGKIEISVADIRNDSISYTIRSEKRIFRTGLLAKSLKESQSLVEKEHEFFGDQEAKIRSLLPDRIDLRLPCPDKEICGQFIAFFVDWLDTEYYMALQGIDEAERHIERHLGESAPQAPNT